MSSYITPDNGKLVIKSDNDLDLSNISSDDAALHLLGGQYLEGNLYVGGTLVVNGDVVTLGNAGGSLTFNANVSSDILPSDPNTYNIGSDLKKWSTIFSVNVQTEKLQLGYEPAVVVSEVNVTTSVNHINTGTSPSVTMANGTSGQLLTIVVVETPPSAVVVTPANTLGYTDITLTNAGDSVTMLYTDNKWSISSIFRASVS